MSNGKIDIKHMMNEVREDDVFDIKIPAYVVKEVGIEEGECVVTWNKEFEELTNFTPSEIDKKVCNEIFDIHQFQRPEVEMCRYEKVCSPKCELRVSGSGIGAGVLRECWINSIYEKGSHRENIKRCVDIYVFPFISRSKKYALHMLVDRGGVHELEHFNILAKIKPTS